MNISLSYFINNLTFFISSINLLVCFLFFPFADNFYIPYLILVLLNFIFNLFIKNNYLFSIFSFLNLIIFYFYTIHLDSLNLLIWDKAPFLTDDSLIYFSGIDNSDFTFGQSGVIWSSLIVFIKFLFPSFEPRNLVFINLILIFLITLFISNILENLFKYYLFQVSKKSILKIQRFYIYILTCSPYIIYYSFFLLKEIWIIFVLTLFCMCFLNAMIFLNHKKILRSLFFWTMGLFGLIACLIDKQTILVIILIVFFISSLLIFLEKNKIFITKKLKKNFIYILIISFIGFNFETFYSFLSSYLNQFSTAGSNNFVLFLKGIFSPLPTNFLNYGNGNLNSIDAVLINITPLNLTILFIFSLFFVKQILENPKESLYFFNRYNFLTKSIFLFPIVGLVFYSFVYSSIFRYKIYFYFFLPFCLLILYDLKLHLRFIKNVDSKTS